MQTSNQNIYFFENVNTGEICFTVACCADSASDRLEFPGLWKIKDEYSVKYLAESKLLLSIIEIK